LKGAESGTPPVKPAEPLGRDDFMLLTNTLSGPDRRQSGPNRRLSHFVAGLAYNRDQGKGRQGQNVIQNTEHRSQGVQQFDLPEAESAPAQKTSVQPPRNYANAIEFQHALQMKTRLLHQIRQLFPSVAAVMPENFVKRAIKPGTARNKNDGPAVILEHLAKIAESRQVIREVFNNVQANDRVEFRLFWKRFAFFTVREAYLHVRAVQPDPLQIIQIQWVDIADPVKRARN